MGYKVLGQSSPAATTATDLYTTPAGVSTVVSTLVVCNRSALVYTYRISVRVAGAAQSNKQYIVYDAVLPGLSSDYHTFGMTLNEGDVVTVYCSSDQLSFSLFGIEQ